MNYIADDGSFVNEHVAPRTAPARLQMSPSSRSSLTADTTIESAWSRRSGLNDAMSDAQTSIMADESFVANTVTGIDGDFVEEETQQATQPHTNGNSLDRHSVSSPRCIHEWNALHNPTHDPSRSFSEDESFDTTVERSFKSYCDCLEVANHSFVAAPSSIRANGWISPVDLDEEIHSFVALRASKKMSASRQRMQARGTPPVCIIIIHPLMMHANDFPSLIYRNSL